MSNWTGIGIGEPTTELVLVSMTVTVLSAEFVTYTRCVVGLAARPCGDDPTGMDVTVVWVAVSMTETLLEPLFRT